MDLDALVLSIFPSCSGYLGVSVSIITPMYRALVPDSPNQGSKKKKTRYNLIGAGVFSTERRILFPLLFFFAA